MLRLSLFLITLRSVLDPRVLVPPKLYSSVTGGLFAAWKAAGTNGDGATEEEEVTVSRAGAFSANSVGATLDSMVVTDGSVERDGESISEVPDELND